MFPGSCCDLSDLWGVKGGWQDVLRWHLIAPQCVEINSGKQFTPVNKKSLLSGYHIRPDLQEYQHRCWPFLCCYCKSAFDYWGKIFVTHMLCLCNYLLVIHAITHIYIWKQTQASMIGCWEISLGLFGSIAGLRPREVQVLGSRQCRLYVFNTKSFHIKRLNPTALNLISPISKLSYR